MLIFIHSTVIPKKKTRWENIGDRIHELITTEEVYIAKLKCGVERYIDTIPSNETISDEYKEKFQIVSTALKNVLKFHQNLFLIELQKCENQIKRISEAFLRMIDSLSVNNKFYVLVSYAMKKRLMSEIVEENSIHFTALATYFEDKLGIQSLLMEPIQRMFKYRLLMEDIIKELHKISVYEDKSKELLETLKQSTLAVYWIRRVLDNTNEVAKLDTIDFTPETEVNTYLYFQRYFQKSFFSLSNLFSLTLAYYYFLFKHGL